MRTPRVDLQGKVTVTRIDAPDWLHVQIEPRPGGGRDVQLNRQRWTERQATQMQQLLNTPAEQDNQP